MTPDEKRMLIELYTWMQARKTQQLAYPIDDASKNALGAVISNGAGTGATTQTLNLTGNAQSIDVPVAYTGYRIVVIDGGQYKIPYI